MKLDEIEDVIREELKTYALEDDATFFPSGAAFEALESLAYAFAKRMPSPTVRSVFVTRCGFDYDPERLKEE